MKVKFSAEIEVPDGTPFSDVKSWLQFELGESGQLSGSNSMIKTDLITLGCVNVKVRT